MKRYLIEAIGTFFLTTAVSLSGHPIAIGLMLMAMMYVGARISGGHFNPAVSFAMFLEKSLSADSLWKYWAAQAGGATAALFLFMMVTENMFVPEMAPGTSAVAATFMEGLFTMVLCWVCLTMVNQYYRTSALQGLVVGLTFTALVFIGGLFNPAIAVGSIVCAVLKEGSVADMPSVMVYVVGPLLGSFAASYVYNKCTPNE